MKYFLNFLKAIYLLVTTIDHRFFKFFNFLVYKPVAKVISVGNLSMGGTGKTPVLFELVNEFKEKKICVISRGYKSPWENSFFYLCGEGPHPMELTDEALLFNQRFPQIPILLGKRRDRSAKFAERKIKPELLVLDDGFQYRRLRKDVEILLWDCLTKPEEADLVPIGRLREPIERLRDASIILLTRCEIATQQQIDYWTNWLAAYSNGIPVIPMKTCVEGLFDHKGIQVTPLNYPDDCIAFSAIGRPESFIQQLAKIGIHTKEAVKFRDHHRFTEQELESIVKLRIKHSLKVICTEKDRVKIPKDLSEKLQILTLRIRVKPVSGLSLHSELVRNGIRLQ